MIPRVITGFSPNYDRDGQGNPVLREETAGVVLHSTRGGASSLEAEYRSTVNWLSTPASRVSAHAVIAADGELTILMDPRFVAWHAREYNTRWLGLEFIQRRLGDPILDVQYESAAWWLIQRARQFGFPLNRATLPQHFEIPPGVRDGKTDIMPPFSIDRLLQEIDQQMTAGADQRSVLPVVAELAMVTIGAALAIQQGRTG